MDQPHINPYNAGPAQIPAPLAPGSVMASPTVIEFALDLEDYLAWNWHKVNTLPPLIRQRRIQWLSVPLLCLVAEVWIVQQLWREPIGLLLVFGGICPLLALFYIFWFPSRYRRAVRKNAIALYNQGTNRAMYGHRRLEISPAGIHVTSELFETTFRWPLIVQIEVTEQHAFLDTGGMGGIILPRNAFTQDAVFQAFIATVRRYQEAAQDAEIVHPEIV
jgi:hypothetical protein